jgi:hypothetical protein
MKALKWLFALALVLIVASLLVRSYIQAHKDPDQEEGEGEEEEAIKAPSRVSVVNGQTVVTLDVATQGRLGIVIAPLRAVSMRRRDPAAATVLSAQGLVALRNAYVSAEAQAETAQAQLVVSSQEYERLKTLYAENQNASMKALQAAQGMLRANQARLDAARKGLEIARAAVQQSWGGMVANWVARNSPLLMRVMNQQAMLVQVSLPPGASYEDPPEINLSTPNGNSVNASYVSPFPQIDPRIQGISMLYLARAYPTLQPGMNLVAHLPVGKRLRGVVVPQSAVVWRQGQAWVYEQTASTQFTRRLVPTDEPLRGGYFATQGFRAGTRVVVQGAQVLLSEEFRSQIQPED